ncbi:uncharacterized protein VDAG_02412 [Verticillium dahliae VdLs.17]|uniref:Hypervirulence associated protein TUDOR domain-containing protein n=1 Tax=Verticillium dahliae (strain VdLs.17 / ATCC MYA-4575 / FGSC 10137) TaxID=498257 RepID=G2WXT0_VERDV|nr:uncharacterized protein VDAG_02412 [Verticillium dahliae VdLs.17]EGY20888.1 hypothetical protein VDAG_02412 [Verticillium dahliae VdLs.17]
MSPQVQDKNSETIKVGDHVWTPFRGGKREGEVERVDVTEQDAQQAGVKNPPKVTFSDQHGHKVSHNPETLQHTK